MSEYSENRVPRAVERYRSEAWIPVPRSAPFVVYEREVLVRQKWFPKGETSQSPMNLFGELTLDRRQHWNLGRRDRTNMDQARAAIKMTRCCSSLAIPTRIESRSCHGWSTNLVMEADPEGRVRGRPRFDHQCRRNRLFWADFVVRQVKLPLRAETAMARAGMRLGLVEQL